MIQCTNIRPPDLAIDGETIREMFKVNGYGIDLATFRKACAKLNWTMAWNKDTDIVEVWTIGITGHDRILKQILRSILCP